MNENLELNLDSVRAKKARMALSFTKFGLTLCNLIFISASLSTIYLILIQNSQLGYFVLAIGLFAMMWLLWYRYDLKIIAPKLPPADLSDLLDKDLLSNLTPPITPKSIWNALENNWQTVFITNRLLLDKQVIIQSLSANEADSELIWRKSLQIQSSHNPNELTIASVATALISTNELLVQYLEKMNLKSLDVLEVHAWLERVLEFHRRPKQVLGGIGRDWAFGFTPNLDKFSINISQQIQKGGGFFHFLSRSNAIEAMITALDQAGGIAVVGNAGIGKTSSVFALAERLLQGTKLGNTSIKDHQIVSLSASAILSAAKQDLEKLMLTLFGEAVSSGNMIIFLDEAQLFFQDGVGSFDLSQILLPIIQNHKLKLICTFTTSDWQRLKQKNSSLAAALTPITLPEPPKEDTLKILEDSALNFESRTNTMITYDALREAYRLSELYIQDMAFPGRAIHVLEQSTSFAVNKIVNAQSVQNAIESTIGVKVGGVQAQEADVLLNLEDRIHERMINQTRAVSAVANALRRARAGVSNTTRPFGSFLFLGPTGVGKTELARSLAATYYGNEKNMVRLDMSEYQQLDDIDRLLDTGQHSESLMLAIRKQPFSVVLLDEIEKAHGGVLNLLLQLLDEGQLTDINGQIASFKSAIIIVTSNAGANEIIDRINKNLTLANFERPLIDQLISNGVFKPELVNRFDSIVLFRPLTQEELGQVALLMLAEVNRNLSNQNISVELTSSALGELVRQGYDPQFGSRPMRRVIQRTVEDAVANRILSGQATPGTKILLDLPDITVQSNIS